MRALEFITGHVIFKLRYNQMYQLKTTLEALMMKKGLHICPNILLSTKTSVVSRLLHTLSI